MIKALMYIDYMSIRKNIIFSCIASLIVVIYSAYNGKFYIIAPTCIYLSMILTSLSYLNDCKFKFHNYLFSMPVSRKIYIISKLMYSFELGIVGGVATSAILVRDKGLPLGLICIVFLSTVLVSVLLSSFQLVFLVKFGEGKGRLVVGMAYMLFFGVTILIKNELDAIIKIIANFKHLSLQTFSVAVLVLCLAFVLINIRLLIKFINEKEY